jgi:RNA polymerase sigma-70 factor (ECF subfamily)
MLKGIGQVGQAGEAALVVAARRGDRAAAQELLGRQWGWLKGLLYSILRNWEGVDEALQEVCVKVLEKMGTLREPERFRPWLARVARNVAYTQGRAAARRPGVSLEDLRASGAEPAAGGEAVLETLGRQELAGRVEEALGRLPEKYAEVFLLKYAQDLSYADIAEILEITVTTVQIRLVRARRMLQDHLAGRPVNKVPRT